MPHYSSSAREQRLETELRVSGPASGRELARRSGYSQPTVSRTLAGMAKHLISIGSGRSARYGLRRTVRSLGTDWPVFRISPEGRPVSFGHLRAFHGGFLFEPRGATPDWMQPIDAQPVFDGLPFFLSDSRPQGYLGRIMARELPRRLGFPSDPRSWSDDDTLHYLLEYGSDVPGDLAIGEAMLNEALTGQRPGPIDREDRAAVYPELVDRVQAGLVPGSSAGGEQPKFTAAISDGSGGESSEVIVKFSPRLGVPAGIRWADLLISECQANRTLQASGIAVADMELIFTPDRVYLESRRFDRVGTHGRRGLLSAETIAASYIGADGTWTDIAIGLRDFGALTNGAVDEIRTLDWFGRFIANTDMHLGNLSFWFSNDTYPFQPAPVYDMLPMGYAPLPDGEVIEREFELPVPLPADHEVIQAALPLARTFWSRIIDDERISHAFRRTAADSYARLDEWVMRFGF